MTYAWEQLSVSDLQRFPKDRTVFFFSVGVVQARGPHLPLFLDLQVARALSERLAKRLETEEPTPWVSVLAPGWPLGVQADVSEAAFRVRPHVLRDALIDSTRALMRMGFVHFVCVSGTLTPRQLTTIEEAGKAIRRYWPSPFRPLGGLKRGAVPVPTFLSLSSAGIPWQKVLAAPFWSSPVEWGGKKDTSLALAVCSEWVNPSYLQLPAAALPERGIWGRLWERWGLGGQVNWRSAGGYWGAPGEATEAEGRALLDARVEQVYPLLLKILGGAPPRSEFRSWYSILWPNSSFFTVWLLLAGFLVLGMAWVLSFG
jgi:creatinine amidohydrolase/Fe(II)-dependent formamide hydrolase-like protein